jgi:hypothetical protein
MAVDRRAAFGQIAVGAAVVASMPQLASADGAVSASTILKARAKYGDRIVGLKSAVASGDFDAVAAEKSAFILFNSGAYPRVVDKSDKADAVKATNAIFAAVKGKDAASLKSAYASYVSSNNIRAIPNVDPKNGQGYGSDYGVFVKTNAA